MFQYLLQCYGGVSVLNLHFFISFRLLSHGTGRRLDRLKKIDHVFMPLSYKNQLDFYGIHKSFVLNF